MTRSMHSGHDPRLRPGVGADVVGYRADVDARVELQAEIDAPRDVVFELVSTAKASRDGLTARRSRSGRAVPSDFGCSMPRSRARSSLSIDAAHQLHLGLPGRAAGVAVGGRLRRHLARAPDAPDAAPRRPAGERARDDHEALWRFWFPWSRRRTPRERWWRRISRERERRRQRAQREQAPKGRSGLVGGHGSGELIVTESRSARGATTVASAPQPRIQMRISCVPATRPCHVRLPSSCHSSRWLGCQVVSATRRATVGEKRTAMTSMGWSAMTSQPSRIADTGSQSGSGSNVSGVSAASRMRSTLKVRRACRASSQPMR